MIKEGMLHVSGQGPRVVSEMDVHSKGMHVFSFFIDFARGGTAMKGDEGKYENRKCGANEW